MYSKQVEMELGFKNKSLVKFGLKTKSYFPRNRVYMDVGE